jgi:dienelactone hydrolase
MYSRRDLFLLTAAQAIGRASQVQYANYSRCLPDYLTTLATSAYTRRNAALAALHDAAAIKRRQAWVRETFWRLTGGQPERTPLQLRTTGSFERPGYKVEKIVYESRPGIHVTANLYLPSTGKAPYPGVLFQMGHSLNGKAYTSYQKCCQGLTRLGYIVLAFDPMGQGERRFYPQISDADAEHSIAGGQLLLTGDTSTRFQVWDAVRSLDVLSAHPLVDPKRIGTTGQSGGGTVSMLLAAVDDRLAAAAISSGNTENFACANFNSPGSTDDAEQNFINSGANAFDRWDLLYPIAPKPLLILASARDSFGTYSPRYLSSGRAEFDKLKAVYQVLSSTDKIAWNETPTPHTLSYFLRTQIYQWFERWLHNRPLAAVEEPQVAPEPDELLRVGPTGNVIPDFGGKSPRQLALAQQAPKQTIASLLHLDPPTTAPAIQVSRVPSERLHITAIEIPSAPGVKVPAYLFESQPSAVDKPVLIVADPRGRSARWAEGGLYHQLAETGVLVCAVDLRGIGDMMPEVGRGNQNYTIPHATDEAYGWASLILGKPMVGQRVTDILASVRAMAGKKRRIVLAASGHLTVPALFAAALEPKIDTTYLASPLLSYRSVLDFDDYKLPVSNWIPSIIGSTDLPQVAAQIAPRRVILAGTVDGAGAACSVALVQSIYSNSAECRSIATWDAPTLSAL